MRKTRNQQLPLAEATVDHPKAKELLRISEIFVHNDSIYDMALQDIGLSDNGVGANGMTAEQVKRAAIIKQIDGYSYREMAFHLAYFRPYSQLCRIGIGGKAFRNHFCSKGSRPYQISCKSGGQYK